MQPINKLFSKLDLNDFILSYEGYLAREKPIFLEGDTKVHFAMMSELQEHVFKSPPSVTNLDTQLIHLTKQGVLHVSEIYEFVKIVAYMKYLKNCYFEGRVGAWLDKIEVPEIIEEIVEYFDEKGQIKSSIDERLSNIKISLEKLQEAMRVKFKQIISNSKLDAYLVDRQIHYINAQEALLVRGGFNHVLKGVVVARSSGGFFYVVPTSLDELKKQESVLLDEKEMIIAKYCQKISADFGKNYLFLKFINREFDRFDAYCARVNFAKDKNLEFVLPNKSLHVKLKSFKHPALNEPRAVDVDFQGSVLMITGVNAGGKTMLLKSILSATLLAKYLIPMPIDSANSSIGSFKNIEAIIEDPQNVNNDISTFAGRMTSFSKLFGKHSTLVGVDEIELGTDADEAASLFFVIIKQLITQGIKIIITTHHKRLASLLATTEGVELKAALYNEKLQRPTFEFLKGTIGKSYAFETALRYGIPASIIERAKKVYGEDKEKLNELIQKNIDLELAMKQKLKMAQLQEQKATALKERLEDEKEAQKQEFEKKYAQLQHEFNEAINLAKRAAKSDKIYEIHQNLNRAHQAKKMIQAQVPNQKPIPLEVGDRVKYKASKGVIKSIKKEQATIECNGITLRVPLSSLKRSSHKPLRLQASKIRIEKPTSGGVKLDLHGLRADEATEKLDKFISDALLSGFDEVLVYHGIGTGKLAYAVREFLSTHPSIISFEDAPPSQGGFGAKIIKL